MKTILHPSSSRGTADHGWLKTAHTFSFAGYYNPERVHYGVLRVLNDDWIAGGTGFGKHPHDNMEIVTIPLTGALEHQDSMGNKEVLRMGEVQAMSAGTGVFHSEYNASATDPCSLLQIWVIPERRGVEPRYEQRYYDVEALGKEWHSVVNPMGQGDAMPHAGWPQTFPLLQTVDRDGPAHAIGLRGQLSQFLEKPLLAGQLSNDPDGLRDQ